LLLPFFSGGVTKFQPFAAGLAAFDGFPNPSTKLNPEITLVQVGLRLMLIIFFVSSLKFRISAVDDSRHLGLFSVR
jgi:hypothetical protein